MGPKQPSHTTQTTKVELPKWVDEAARKNYRMAEQIASRPLVQYGGPLVAPISGYTKQAWDLVSQGAGSGAENYAAISDTLRDIMNRKAPTINTHFTAPDIAAQQIGVGDITADQVKAGKFTDVNIADYLNPYIANVEQHALGALDEQRTKALMSNADRAIAAGAFGGSRHGIVDAVTNAEAAKAAGLLSADLRKQGFDTAANLAVGDLTRTLQGDLANQQSNLAAAQSNQQTALSAGQSNQQADLMAKQANQNMALELQKLGFSAEQANQLAELQTTAQQQSAADSLTAATESEGKSRLQDFASLISAGDMEQMHNQQQIQADLQQFLERRDYPIENLNLLLSSLGMSPYGKTETANKQHSGGSSGTDYAMMGLGLIKALPFFLGLFSSDREDKTDIKKLGKDPNTGLDIYAYRYKGDPKSYPKVVGPMAQDIAKKFPAMVGEIGGHKVVRGALARG